MRAGPSPRASRLSWSQPTLSWPLGHTEGCRLVRPSPRGQALSVRNVYNTHMTEVAVSTRISRDTKALVEGLMRELRGGGGDRRADSLGVPGTRKGPESPLGRGRGRGGRQEGPRG